MLDRQRARPRHRRSRFSSPAIALAVIPLVLGHQGSDVVTDGLIYTAYLPLIIFGVVFIGALNGLHRYAAFSLVRISIFALMVASQIALLIARREHGPGAGDRLRRLPGRR